MYVWGERRGRLRQRILTPAGKTVRLQIPTPAKPLLNTCTCSSLVSSPRAQGLGGPALRRGVAGPREPECLAGHSRHRRPLSMCCLRPLARVSKGGRACGSGAGVRRAVKGGGGEETAGGRRQEAGGRLPEHLSTSQASYVAGERPYLAEAGLVAAGGPYGGRTMLAEAGLRVERVGAGR